MHINNRLVNSDVGGSMPHVCNKDDILLFLFFNRYKRLRPSSMVCNIFFPCTPPWLLHLHALLRPYRLEGWRATKAVEVVLKSSLKGHLAEEGAQILNRTVRSGSFVGRTRVPPTLWWMQVGGRMAEGGVRVHSFRATRGEAWLLRRNGRRPDEGRGGTGHTY